MNDPEYPDTNLHEPLLSVTDLVISFAGPHGRVAAVKGASLSINPGETVAIVGESGSGKSTLAMSVLRLLAGNGEITSGTIMFDGKDLATFKAKDMQKVRGRLIGLVPQDPMSNLNPLMKVGAQVAETLIEHGFATRSDAGTKVTEALAAAGISDPETRAGQYPHELSGGLRQRVLIAIGLACQPRLLIADEPTSALDVTVQRTILDQIENMTKRLGTAVLLITHDLALAAERAQKVVVMNKGEVVECGRTEDILSHPQHAYTKALLAAAPNVAAVRLKQSPPALRDGSNPQQLAGGNLVEVRELSKTYWPRRKGAPVHANKSVSFDIPRGTTVALVGESGSGKTTTSRMLLRLVDQTAGSITFNGQSISSMNKSSTAMFRQRVQPIFQDPYSSLNPTYSVKRIIAEPLAYYKRGNRKQRDIRVRELLEQVALPLDVLDRRPSQLSGGQRQRVAIARAIALNPDLLICDEPVSALDVMVQAQILKLMSRLQDELGLSYLFISHDLAVVRLISDYVCVMTAGTIVEAAPSEILFQHPQHPYTRTLLGSIPGNSLSIPDQIRATQSDLDHLAQEKSAIS